MNELCVDMLGVCMTRPEVPHAANDGVPHAANDGVPHAACGALEHAVSEHIAATRCLQPPKKLNKCRGCAEIISLFDYKLR